MSNLKKIFFTSDLHLHHENAINFDKRPWQNTRQMRRDMIKRFNATVTDNSLLYILGDIGTNQQVVREFFSKIRCDIAVILGNHDKGANFYYGCGAKWVGYNTKLLINQQIVTLSHCPLLGVPREDTTNMRGAKPGENWHKEFKHGPLFSVKDEGQFHLHGHIHSPNGGKSVKIQGRQYDVGVPGNKYAPVSQSTIESWISKTLKKEKYGTV